MPRIKVSKEMMIAILACIMILQCLNLFYWQSQRGNFFADELFSFGTANAYITDSNPYITDSSDWKYDEWLDAYDIQGMLRVDRNEWIASLPLGKQLRLIATKRPFMGLLNYTMFAVGSNASFFKYAKAVTILNALFLIISDLLLAYCVMALTKDRVLSLLSIVMFGFSSIIVCMCEYLRFYMLTIMLFLIVVVFHQKMIKENDSHKFLIWELAAFISAYFAFLHSELILIICGALFGLFFLSLLCLKRYRHAIIYSLPLALGVYRFIYLKTNLLDVLFHPASYAQSNSHGVAAVTNNLMTITMERGLASTQAIMHIIGEKWFGYMWILYLCLALMIACVIFSVYREWKRGKGTHNYDKNRVFIIILLLTAVISLIFNILAGIISDRHNSFAIVLLMIVFWYCAGQLQHVTDRKWILTIVTSLTIVCVLAGQKPEKYPYLYINDIPTKNISDEYAGTDSVLFMSGDNKTYNPFREQHASYDAIIHTGKHSRMYVFDPDKEPSLKNIDDVPDRFLALCIDVGGADRMRRALDGTGYEAELIGTTHLNEIYLCSRK